MIIFTFYVFVSCEEIVKMSAALSERKIPVKLLEVPVNSDDEGSGRIHIGHISHHRSKGRIRTKKKLTH